MPGPVPTSCCTNKALSRSYTVSPLGLGDPGVVAPNNGADFGPDSLLNNVGPGLTVTGGLQEALLAIASGGRVVDIGGGTYKVSASVHGTGDDQELVLNGSSTLSIQSGGSWTVLGSVLVPFSDGGTNNWSRVHWHGNGVTVAGNAVHGPFAVFNLGNVAFATASPNRMSSECVFEGFNLQRNVDTGLAMIGANGPGFIPTFDQTIRQVLVREVMITYDESATGSPSGPAGIYVGGSAREVQFEDCFVDQTAATGMTDADAYFVRSQYGNVARIRFLRCAAKTQGGNRCFELQGSTNGPPPPTLACITEYLTFEDCDFIGGTWNLIDDDLGAGIYSYVNNIEFKRCLFSGQSPNAVLCETGTANPGIVFGNPPNVQSIGYPLGYVRFIDCDLDGLAWSSFLSGSLTNRTPGQSIPISFLFTASPATYTNGQSPTSQGGDIEVCDQLVTVAGGFSVGVQVDGQPSGGPGAYLVRAGHSLTLTWVSIQPVVNLIPL